MKRSKIIVSLLAIVMMAVMLTGCLAVEMKVNANGSCDMTYTIDMSQLGGMMSKEDLEKAIEESVTGMNDEAGSKIAKLKSVKEDKKKETMTAVISISDVNKMGDGAYFGTVKKFRKENEDALDNLVGKNKKSVDAKKVSDNLSIVYLPMGGTEEYGAVEVTVIIPGTIQYVADGGEIKKGNTAVFDSGSAIVVFKKGGGFPIWILILVALALVGFVLMKKKPTVAAPVVAPPAAPQPAPVVTPSASPVAEVPADDAVEVVEQVEETPNV